MFTAPYTLGPVTVNATRKQYASYLRVVDQIDPKTGMLKEADLKDLKAYNRFADAVKKYNDENGPWSNSTNNIFRPNY